MRHIPNPRSWRPGAVWKAPVFLTLTVGLTVSGFPSVAASSQSGALHRPESPEWIVDIGESTLAVITFRGGVAGRLAHDHLIHAGDLEAEFHFDPQEPEGARFAGSLKVEDLVVDDLDRMARAQPVLQEFDLLPREFGDVGDEGRADVRTEMLAEGQLHAEAWPEIRFRSLEVEAAADDPDFPWRVHAALTVRGEERATWMRARWEADDGGKVRIQAAGEFHFTDFGIEPYRAFLGSVRNQDRFVVFLDLTAHPRP